MARTSEEIKAAALASGNPAAKREAGTGYTSGWSLQNVNKNFAAIGELLGGGGRRGAGGTSERLGDRIPQAPDYAAEDTGVTGPYGESTVAGMGAGVPRAEEERAREEVQAQREDQARATEFAGGVEKDVGEITGEIDVTRQQVEEDRRDFQRGMETARDEIDQIPTEITNEFDRLQEQFGEAADASFDRIDSQRGEALANAEQGRSAAMQAAVQGIQGNVNNQVAQIMANPELTTSQKQSMVAQVRLSGASSITPAIGQTVLEFNKLSADIATKFGGITGQIESTIVAAKAELTGLQGSSFATAQTAVGQMTTQLLEIEAGASASFASSQNQLLATRSHATMTGNDILLRTLPEQSTPYLDLTGAATAAFEIGAGLMDKQFAMNLQTTGMKIFVEYLRSQQGTPLSNMLQGALSGFASGGPAGALMGGAGGLLGSMGPRI